MEEVEKIRSLLPEKYCVEHRGVPSYIQMFMPSLTNKRITLVYKLIPTKDTAKPISTKTVLDESAVEIGGTPLPAPFSYEDTFNLSTVIHQLEDLSEEEQHGPIPLPDARKLLGYCNLNMDIQNPIWVVTKGDLDLLSTWVIKSRQATDRCQQTLRCWAKVKDCDDIPSMVTLNATHERLRTGYLVSTPIYSVDIAYEMTPLLSTEKDFAYSQSTLMMSWNAPSVEPPLKKKVSVVTRTKIGHGGGPIRFLWDQLVLIRNYLELLDSNEEKTSDVTFPSSFNILGTSTISNEAIISEINRALDKRSRGSRVRSQVDNFYDLVDSLSSHKEIKDSDPISKIWLALISCSNSNDYFACLYHLSSTCEIMTTSSESSESFSRISLAVMKSSRLQLNPSDWKTNVQFLVELGLEKVRNDLFWVFDKLIPSIHLAVLDLPSFTEVNPSEWRSLAERWMNSLTRHHCSLELIYATHSSLHFSEEGLLRDISISIINTLVKSTSSPVRDVTQLVADPMLSVTSNLAPSVQRPANKPTRWVMSINSDMTASSVTSVFYFGSKCPFSWYTRKVPLNSSSSYFVTFQSISST